jgi:hypothetical protein
MLMAFRLISALVLRPMQGFPTCCLALFWLKNAGAWSSSWGQPLGRRCLPGFGAPPWVGEFAPVRGVLGPVAFPLVRSLAALGFPLVRLVSRKRDGGSVPLGRVPGDSVAALLPSRRVFARV